MNNMFTISATEARKEWSSLIDTVVREKPAFVTRTRDLIILSNLQTMEALLERYSFTAEEFIEDNGSVTLSLNEIDLVVNSETKEKAVLMLAEELKEYAEEYYNEFNFWSNAPNRKSHLPYVLKVLLLDDINKIGATVKCQPGKN
jgi:PHD/YefM family antitoxin component YafN of YafNO toxin-antitoxin module